MEQTIFSDIWSHLSSTIDLTLMILIIACGYILGRTALTEAIFPGMRTTLKVLIVTAPITVLYCYFREVDPGIGIASFFIAFGFHTVVLKFIDQWVSKFSSRNSNQ